MAVQVEAAGQPTAADRPWYARSPDGVTAALHVDPAVGLTAATFDSKQINWTILGEFVLAVLVTQMDVFNRLLGTTQLNLREFAWALVPAVALLVLWELGKLAVRRWKPATAVPDQVMP